MGPNGTSLVQFQGPKKSRFSGPTPSNAPRNDVAPLKTITYRAIKTTGTLIVIIESLREAQISDRSSEKWYSNIVHYLHFSIKLQREGGDRFLYNYSTVV